MTVITDAPEYIAGWVSGHFPYGYVFQDYHAIGLVRGNRLIAGCVFDRYSGLSVSGHIVAEGPINRAFLYEIHRFAYVTLGVETIDAVCAADNHRAHDFLVKLGFKPVGSREHFGGNPGLAFRQARAEAEKWLALTF